VAVRAIGLNFADVFAIWGLYGATHKGSFTPGLEYAGVVE
jgi:alcohol dehydrogenase